MSVQTKEKNIDGHQYRIEQHTTRKSAFILWRLLGSSLPSIIKLLLSIKKSMEGDSDINSDDVTTAAILLFERLDEEKLNYIFDELFALAFVDGKPLLPQFDLHFQGNLGVMLQVLYFSYEVNYGNFLGVEVIKAWFAKLPRVTIE